MLFPCPFPGTWGPLGRILSEQCEKNQNKTLQKRTSATTGSHLPPPHSHSQVCSICLKDEKQKETKSYSDHNRDSQIRTFNSLLGASLVAQLVKNPSAMQQNWVWSLGWEDPLEKGMATHSIILDRIVHRVTESRTRLSYIHILC